MWPLPGGRRTCLNVNKKAKASQNRIDVHQSIVSVNSGLLLASAGIGAGGWRMDWRSCSSGRAPRGWGMGG